MRQRPLQTAYTASMPSSLTRRAFVAASAAPFVSRAAQRRRLNVLLLMADDMNNVLGCYGHPRVKTPSLDRLAAQGVKFERAYCQFPLCGPSRASMLTGLRPQTTRVLGNNIDFRDFLPDAVTLPQLFRQNGYYAARDGKMFHMNVPRGVGTNQFQDDASWDLSYSPPGLENKSPGERPTRREGLSWIATPDTRGQADTNAADTAIELLEKHRNRPFFLGVGFLRPHLPFVAPSRFFDLYPLNSLELAQNPPEDLDDVPEAHKRVRPWLWNHMKMRESDQRESLRGYYAATSYMDHEAGRVLAALEKLGLAERTVVVFVGDHGWNLGEHTRWQKMSLFEESARVPLIVRAPGTRGNGTPSRALVEMVDIYPTLAELCGLRPPRTLEGQSFAPLLAQPGRAWKKAAFTELQFEAISGFSARSDRYRYMRWEGGGGGEELYDHANDPREFTNLARSGAHRLALEQMREILRAGWRAARA